MRDDCWLHGFLFVSDRTRRRLIRRIIWNPYFTVHERVFRGDATQPTAECYPGRCPVSKVQFFLESVEWPFLKPRFSEDLPGNRYDNTGGGRCTSGRMRKSFCVERGSFCDRFTRGRVNSSAIRRNDADSTETSRESFPKKCSRGAARLHRRGIKSFRVECNQARIDVTINETR